MKNNPVTLDDAQRTKLVDQQMKLLAEEFSYLEYLGCQASCLLVNGKKELYVLGSSGGKRFVHNEPAVLCKFQAMFDVDREKQKWTHEDVRMLFNKKYGEAKGVTGSRVPYLSGGFHVEGLPDNIRLKKPRQYGSKEIQKIMDCQDSISFILETSEGAPLQDFGEDCKELLSNVFGKCDFKVSKDVAVLDINETHNISEIKEIISTHWKVLCPEALTELKKKN
ncbi:uncharacterized protein LOC124447780 [Xenia sp. Carnegie-2017]|uniref:uncharacterized protein LOC124447780 n=1 Tax=Xenia sp. Carnegie-2017 TaxID=2897299 RepID=UPI001F041142|nr:uncharacterized protein LOC124447780 [Xenia sp. Carnegie-2017]